jgi:hypothetical protein
MEVGFPASTSSKNVRKIPDVIVSAALARPKTIRRGQAHPHFLHQKPHRPRYAPRQAEKSEMTPPAPPASDLRDLCDEALKPIHPLEYDL